MSLSNLNTVKQTGSNIENILKDVSDFSLFLFQNDAVIKFLKTNPDTDNKIIQQRKTEVNRELIYLLTTKKYIHSVYIKGFNGLTIDTRGTLKQLDDNIMEEVILNKGAPVWLFHKIINYNQTETSVISLVRLINDINNITKKMGILKINISEKYIAENFSSEIFSENVEYYIIDNKNQIISGSERNKLTKRMKPKLIRPEISRNKTGYYKVRIENKEFLVTYYNLDYLDYKLINLVPLEELLVENRVIKNVTIFSILISFIICLVFILMFYYRILQPLNKIRNVMEELENENFDIRLNFKGYNEITVLGTTFNKMSARLKNLMEQIYLEKVKQKEAELKALQAQVNPHFLYNTLDTIYWMSKMEKATETADLIKALARLFRLSLNNGNEFTTVEKEIEHLENYLFIQKKRHQGLINFSINVDTNLLNYHVVKLVLQPLVENAIIHGIEEKDGKGSIIVNIKREDKYLLYEVIDDGKGMDVCEINKLLEGSENNKQGFGLKNVNDRIKLYSGKDCGLKLHSKPDHGTTVIVKQILIIGGKKHVQDDDS